MNSNIKDYLGFKGRPSIGEVQTPNELAQEIINKLPEEIFISDKTTFLDPCFGSGTFLEVITKKLREYGHSDENINSRLFGVEKSIRFINIVGKVGNIKPTLIHANFLEYNFKNMKFDVIIGNPPFQTPGAKSNHKKYWVEFLLKGRTLTTPQGYLSFVTPSSYINTSRHGKTTLGVGTSTQNLIYYKDLGAYFKGIGIDVCYYIEQNYPYQNQTEYNGKLVNLKEGIPLVGDKAIIQSIVDKVVKSNFPKHSLTFNWFDKEELNPTNIGTEVLISAYKTGWLSKELPHSEKLKLVLPFSSSYKKQFITSKPVGHLNNYILLEDEQHGKNIMSYTLSKLFILVANNFMKSSGFTPFARNKNIPLLDNKHWTNSGLYSLFGLTQEEVDFVENNIK